MKIIFPLLLFLVFSSCTSSVKQDNQSLSKKNERVLGCYVYQDAKNKVLFQVREQGDQVIAQISYDYYEKDKNTGTFRGQLDGDYLLGTYTFLSEGITSTRELAFLVKDDQLIEGYGELNAAGTAFLNKNAITYDSKMPLGKRDCESLD